MAISISAATVKKLQSRATRDGRDLNGLIEEILSAYLSAETPAPPTAKSARRQSPKLPPPDAQHLRKRVLNAIEEAARRDEYGDTDEIETRVDEVFTAEVVARLESGQFQETITALGPMTDELVQEAYEHSHVEDLNHMFDDIARLWIRAVTESSGNVSPEVLGEAHRGLVASAEYLDRNYGGKGPFKEAIRLLASRLG